MNWKAVTDYLEMSRRGADCIFEALAASARRKERFNLGLATGNTMIDLYRRLAERLNANRTPLDRLHTYNLDEYVGADGRAVPPDHPLSYRKYMHENLFARLDGSLGLDADNIHFPDADDPVRFDSGLTAAGGLDVQLLGIGFNGHIAFNEPEPADFGLDTFADLPSRIIDLDERTLETNARLTANGDRSAVPRRAVTMGMKPILAAKRILLLACFAEQEKPLRRMLADHVPTPELPASYLLRHPNATVIYTADMIGLET